MNHEQLKQAFIDLDKEFCNDADRRQAGCTACIAIVQPINNKQITPHTSDASDSSNSSSNKLNVATNNSNNNNDSSNTTRTRSGSNSSTSTSTSTSSRQRYKVLFVHVGDSRAILIESNGDVSGVTTDHKPDNPTEQQRITSANGSVSVGRVDGELAMSRAIGDYSYKGDSKLSVEQQKVIPVPDILELTADNNDIICICCDGLFEKLTTEEVSQFIHCVRTYDNNKHNNDPAFICSLLLDYSLAKGSKDNMSSIIIQFNDGTSYNRNDGELLAGSLDHIDIDDDKKYIETYVDFAKSHDENITLDVLRHMSDSTDNIRQQHMQLLDTLDRTMEEWRNQKRKQGNYASVNQDLHNEQQDDDEIL